MKWDRTVALKFFALYSQRAAVYCATLLGISGVLLKHLMTGSDDSMWWEHDMFLFIESTFMHQWYVFSVFLPWILKLFIKWWYCYCLSTKSWWFSIKHIQIVFHPYLILWHGRRTHSQGFTELNTNFNQRRTQLIILISTQMISAWSTWSSASERAYTCIFNVDVVWVGGWPSFKITAVDEVVTL